MVSSQFRVSRHHMGQTVGKIRDFPGLKKRTQAVFEPTDDLCIWKESQTCVLFSKLGLGAIHL